MKNPEHCSLSHWSRSRFCSLVKHEPVGLFFMITGLLTFSEEHKIFILAVASISILRMKSRKSRDGTRLGRLRAFSQHLGAQVFTRRKQQQLQSKQTLICFVFVIYDGLQDTTGVMRVLRTKIIIICVQGKEKNKRTGKSKNGKECCINNMVRCVSLSRILLLPCKHFHPPPTPPPQRGDTDFLQAEISGHRAEATFPQAPSRDTTQQAPATLHFSNSFVPLRLEENTHRKRKQGYLLETNETK